MNENEWTCEHGVVRAEGCDEYGCGLTDVTAHLSTGPFYAEGYQAGLAHAAAQVNALADRLDKFAEWNLLDRREREERWPDEHSHMVSRPQASTRARALVRDLARALSPGRESGQ